MPDARVVGQSVDTTVFVVAWDRTPRLEVRSALSELQSVDTPICGIALNGIDTRNQSYYGYGGYGRYTSNYYTN